MAAKNIGSFESNEASDPSTAAAPVDDAQWLSELVAILRARWWIVAAGAVLFFAFSFLLLSYVLEFTDKCLLEWMW